MNEYLHVLRNYATFTGRARRREFWMFTLVQTVISVVFGILFGITGGLNEDLTISPAFGLFSVVFALYALATFVPTLAVTVRRLHDTGKSGWFYLITFVPAVGSLIVLIFTIMDSEPGTNKWGPSPKPGLARA
ncbi:DUF805 domain-containing protein [Deinococcus pimensis]|uniref:DUF805 domain-containing protein n=1 Tax=Deinococcus pimensis TaxID=309888 RepID=UPI00048603A1|nr:DUF805 domain-containing protein [Deinococcus pimensis]